VEINVSSLADLFLSTENRCAPAHPLQGALDAPLASDNDNPAAPNTGTAFLRRFRFEACFAYGMAETSRSGYQTKRLCVQCNRR
jgi:hypothetical protein